MKDTQGQTLHSFKILTINAVSHSLMNPLHKPADEKSSSVTLQPQRCENWLQACASVSGVLLRAQLTELMEVGQIFNQ